MRGGQIGRFSGFLAGLERLATLSCVEVVELRFIFARSSRS